MGKRDQGRLVHEIRDALLARDFLPSRVTTIEAETGKELKGIRHPGFTVQKHGGKSVRLSYRTTTKAPVRGSGWVGVQAYAEARMRKLVSFNRALEEAGFVCSEINSRDPMAPYSVWERGTYKSVR